MKEFELNYDVQEIRLSEDHTFRVTTVGDEALPLELLLDLETRRYTKSVHVCQGTVTLNREAKRAFVS